MMKKKRKSIAILYKETKKSVFNVYVVLRLLVIICLILQLIHGDYNNAFLCLLSLILFTLPFFIQKNFKITIPNTLEIIILLFIFAAEILGEINNFYGRIPNWDTMLHTLNGFLAAAVGFALIELLNENSTHFNLSAIYLTLVGFCFSMTIGVVWEFFEYGMDKILNFDMQKDRIVTKISSVAINENGENVPVIIDNIDKSIIYYIDEEGEQNQLSINGYLDIGLNDTMKDLLVNFVGATIYSIFAFLYLYDKEKYNFASKFLVTKYKGEKINE